MVDQIALIDQRRRDGVLSLLDQFLVTTHTDDEWERIAADFGITLAELRELFELALSSDPRIALKARLTLNLFAAGTG